MIHRHLLFALLSIFVVACGSAAGAQHLRAPVPRITSPVSTLRQRTALVENNNAFAFDLYRTIDDPRDDRRKGNVIYSPYSISLAFSMAYAGARGETEAQMADVLRFLPQDEQHPAMNALDHQLSQLGEAGLERATGANGDEKEGDRFRLHVANSLWGQRDLEYRRDFLTTLAQHYGAGLQAIDFLQHPDEARRAINAWVSDETDDRIIDLVPPGSITPNTRLVLANATYFNAA